MRKAAEWLRWFLEICTVPVAMKDEKEDRFHRYCEETKGAKYLVRTSALRIVMDYKKKLRVISFDWLTLFVVMSLPLYTCTLCTPAAIACPHLVSRRLRVCTDDHPTSGVA